MRVTHAMKYACRGQDAGVEPGVRFWCCGSRIGASSQARFRRPRGKADGLFVFLTTTTPSPSPSAPASRLIMVSCTHESTARHASQRMSAVAACRKTGCSCREACCRIWPRCGGTEGGHRRRTRQRDTQERDSNGRLGQRELRLDEKVAHR